MALSPQRTSAGEPQTLAQGLLERLERLPFGRFHWILIGTIFLGTAFDNMDQITLPFVLPEYRREWGISAATASVHPAAGLLGTLIGAFFWGWLADRIGHKAAFIWTIVLFAATSLLNGFAWSFWQIVATCFIMGFGVGGEIPLAFTLIAEYTPARLRGRAEVLTGMLPSPAGMRMPLPRRAPTCFCSSKGRCCWDTGWAGGRSSSSGLFRRC